MKKETLDGKIQELVKIDTVAGFPIYLDSKAAAVAEGYQEAADSVDRVEENVLVEKQPDSALESGSTLELSSGLQEETFNDLDASISQLLSLQEESEERELIEGKEQTIKGKLESLNYF